MSLDQHMFERRPRPQLLIPALQQQSGQVHQLLHVGRLRRSLLDPATVEAEVFFASHCPSVTSSSAGTLTQHWVPLRHAALFIPGTRWDAHGLLIGVPTYREQCSMRIGEHAPRLCRLGQDLPWPSTSVLLSALRPALAQMWCAVYPSTQGLIIIPCVELLRAFYYEAGEALIDFWCTRLPLQHLCWPVMPLSRCLGATAHLCVAAEVTHPQQVRVLAELLFNPAYQATIRQAHAALAIAWQRPFSPHVPDGQFITAPFRLGRTVEVVIQGQWFTVHGQSFFWVSRLLPPPDWFSFAEVLCHPLATPHKLVRHRPPRIAEDDLFAPLPAYSDVLHRYGLPNTYRRHGLVGEYYTNDDLPELWPRNAYLPRVDVTFPWGRKRSAHCPFVTANAEAYHWLWPPSPFYAGVTAGPRPLDTLFQSALVFLQRHGCRTQVRELNNPKQHLGPGQSTYPYVYRPTRLTHTDDRQQRVLEVATVECRGAHFCMACDPDQDVLCVAYMFDLAAWTEASCNHLLACVVSSEARWRYIDIPYGTPSFRYECRAHSVPNLAQWCYRTMLYTIARFRHGHLFFW